MIVQAEMKCTLDRFEDFIRVNTALQAPPHVPEIRLHLADEAHDLWHSTEEELAEIGLPPPFWAFAWAGGQVAGSLGGASLAGATSDAAVYAVMAGLGAVTLLWLAARRVGSPTAA